MKFKKYGCLALAVLLSISGIGYMPGYRGMQMNHEVQAAEVMESRTSFYGDLDKDGSVTLADAQMALKGALKIEKLTDEQQSIGDIDKDGSVQLADAQHILKMALKIEQVIAMETMFLTIEGLQSGNTMITTDSDMELKGAVTGQEELQSIEMTRTQSGKEQKVIVSLKSDGTFASEKIKLEERSNPVSLKVKGVNGTVIEKNLTVYRNSAEVEMSQDVIAFLPEDEEGWKDIRNIEADLCETYLSDNGTEDTSDDECALVVNETSPLYQYIENGQIQENDIIYIPSNDIMKGGLTIRYTGMDDNYTSDGTYDKTTQEVIHGTIPQLPELLSGQGCIAANQLDEENPIAFVAMPDGTQVTSGMNVQGVVEDGVLKTLSDDEVGFVCRGLCGYVKFMMKEDIVMEKSAERL